MQLTQAEFARRYGFNIATLRDWEYGRRSPGGVFYCLMRDVASKAQMAEIFEERARAHQREVNARKRSAGVGMRVDKE